MAAVDSVLLDPPDLQAAAVVQSAILALLDLAADMAPQDSAVVHPAILAPPESAAAMVPQDLAVARPAILALHLHSMEVTVPPFMSPVPAASSTMVNSNNSKLIHLQIQEMTTTNKAD